MTNRVTIGELILERINHPSADSRDAPYVVTIESPFQSLTLEECDKLLIFLAEATEKARDAKRRAYYLTLPELQNAPNFCKSCGHLNDPWKRGWCRCEHCQQWMDRGPFPEQSNEEHAGKCPH
jgi:hypothetical protein